MTAPPVGIERLVADPGPNRVEVYVTNEFKEVGVGIDQNGFITALEEVADSLLSLIDVSGVSEAEVLDDSGQRDVTDLDGDVDVIGHEAEGMDAVPESFSPIFEECVAVAPVGMTEEDILTTVAAENDMIDSAGIMDTGFASHGESLR